MGKLSTPTRVYIFATLLAGIILFIYFAPRLDWQSTWIETTALCILGGLTLLFKVEGSTDHTHYDITFLIYGCALILYGIPVTVVVILAAHLIEWIWHKYPWYIQGFNIASYIIVGAAANMVYELANPSRSLGTFESVIGVLTATAVFTLINHLMVGQIVWLASGENFIQSGIFAPFSLMLDWILLCMGAIVALVWIYNPFAVILILLPLYLIYSTLRVPSLERQVETDPKTGLFNLKYFNTVLETEFQRAVRVNRPVVVVMADLDLLRNINNTYGHLAGDIILVGVAMIIKENSRDYDIVSRFGGEEFAILMPETTPEEAYPIIQSIRQKIEEAEFTVPTSATPIKTTMSFGIAGRETDMDGEDLIHNADVALYHGKLNGRNRVIIYSPDGFHDPFRDYILQEPASARIVPEKNYTAPPNETSNDGTTEPATEKTASVEEIKSPRKLPKNTKQWVDLYILVLGMAAIGLLSYSLLKFPTTDWLGVAVFIILVTATEWSSIDIYIRSTSISVSAVPLIAGILLIGPVCALGMSIAIALVAYFKHKSPLSRFIFNFSNQLIATLICLSLLQFTGSNFTDLPILTQIMYSSITALLVYLITSFFTAIGISIDFGEPVLKIWMEQFSWLAPYYLGMGVIAYTLIFSYFHSSVLGTIVILIPLILLRISQKQFIDRTKDTVNSLKKNNFTLNEQSQEIFRLNNGLLDTLAEVIDLRDPYILGHSQQVTHYAVMIAREMGLSAEQIEIIRKGSLMHDLGKLGIATDLLSKPSPLTDEEYQIIKQHVSIGAGLLKKSESLIPLIPIVLHHHERYDGTGYPDRLKGDEIPLEARIVCLADSVEAMGSDRIYHRALNNNQILDEVRRCSGSQFDPAVVKVFEQILERNGSSIPIPSPNIGWGKVGKQGELRPNG